MNHADAAVSLLLEHVASLHGAAHSDEVAHTPAEQEAVKVALAAGLLHRQGRSLLVALHTDHRTVVARSFRGHLTCASAAEVLGYPVLHPPEEVHVAVSRNHGVRASVKRPLDGVRLHRVLELTPMTVDGLPLVVPAQVVACCLVCMDETPAVAVADAALHRGDVTREEVSDLLTSRYAATARNRLAQTEPGTRSVLETVVRLALRRAGLRVECGVWIEDVGEVDFLVEGWLILEIDGYEFHSSREQIRKDRHREHAAARLGYVTIRLPHQDVMEGERAIVSTVVGAMRGVARSSFIVDPYSPAIARKLGRLWNDGQGSHVHH
ncbi:MULTISPECIES: endonuclease domain-containing protein [Actinomyces]|uniref:endonuclease domain-containing protein n=1 Tax=Actinomyces TaxID=1654 RepID=UPI0015FF9516|nr:MULTISPECIES: hypothetical protein [Actinomyces]